MDQLSSCCFSPAGHGRVRRWSRGPGCLAAAPSGGDGRSDADWTVSEALHTDFRMGDARDLEVEGLGHVDRVRGGRGVQQGPLRVPAPVDRSASASTLVWNPEAEGAEGFADMPDDAWVSRVCVEANNALDDAYLLKAGASHTLTMTIGVE